MTETKITLKNKSIFITGVAGFIGSNLAKRLLSTVEGVKVVGLDNMNHYYDLLGRVKHHESKNRAISFLKKVYKEEGKHLYSNAYADIVFRR